MTEITLFTTKPTGGGAEKVFTSLARYFSGEEIETDFVVLDTGDKAFDAGQANVIEIPHSRIRYAIPWLVRYLNDVSPNAIFSTLTGPNLITVLASKLSRADSEVIVREATIRSEFAEGVRPSNKHRLMNVGVRFLYPRADHVVTISESAGRAMREYLSTDGTNVITIPNPIDVEAVRKDAAESVSHRWFSEEYNVILGVGRLVPFKDFETLIKAFDLYSSDMDRLVILGDGRKREHLEQLVEKRDISGIDFLGYVNNPYPYMQRADVFVSTSQYEAFGNVVLEALACGTPVVATACEGGPPEILANGEYGELAPVGDVQQISSHIRKAVDNDYDQDVLMGRAKDYAIEPISSRYLDLSNNSND